MLYHRYLFYKASPKAISGRTSYYRVRLAFHRYPQLIQAFFNRQWFGPPRGLTRASAWPWVGHLVSGLLHDTWVALFRLAFAAAPSLNDLTLTASQSNSPAYYAKGTPSGIPQPKLGHSPLTACKHTVSGSISLRSRGAFHLSLTVLVRYRSPGST